MEGNTSIQDILNIIKKRIFLIVSLMIIAIGIAASLSFYVIIPIYQAQTQILVNQKPSGQETYSWSQMETDLQLINTYNVIITSSVILNKVIEELELNMTSDQLMNKISVSNENDSKVVNIKVEHQNPEQAVLIANTTARIFKVEVPPLLNVDNINILSEANLSDNPTPIKPRKLLNIASAAVIGLMAGIGLAFLIEVLDTTIKSERDIEETLDLPIIGLVGSISPENENKSSFKSRRQRRT